MPAEAGILGGRRSGIPDQVRGDGGGCEVGSTLLRPRPAPGRRILGARV